MNDAQLKRIRIPNEGLADYYGESANRAARVMSTATGGQVVCVASELEYFLEEHTGVRPKFVEDPIGTFQLKGIPGATALVQLARIIAPSFPQELQAFWEALRKWLNDVESYEAASGDQLSDKMRIALVTQAARRERRPQPLISQGAHGRRREGLSIVRDEECPRGVQSRHVRLVCGRVGCRVPCHVACRVGAATFSWRPA